MAEKYGIQNIQEVLVFGITIGKTLKEDLADKKLSINEIIGLLPTLMKIPDFIAKKQDILNEAKDLSIDEVKQLKAQVGGNITDKDLIDTIEDALNIGVSVRNLIDRYKSKPEAAPAIRPAVVVQ